MKKSVKNGSSGGVGNKAVFQTTNGSNAFNMGEGLYINTLEKLPVARRKTPIHGSETAELQIASWLLTMCRLKCCPGFNGSLIAS